MSTSTNKEATLMDHQIGLIADRHNLKHDINGGDYKAEIAFARDIIAALPAQVDAQAVLYARQWELDADPLTTKHGLIASSTIEGDWNVPLYPHPPTVAASPSVQGESIDSDAQFNHLLHAYNEAEYGVPTAQAKASMVAYIDARLARTAAPSDDIGMQWAKELVKALKRLSFAAQTAGGTAGRDDELVASIAQAEQAMSHSAASRAIDAAAPSEGQQGMLSIERIVKNAILGNSHPCDDGYAMFLNADEVTTVAWQVGLAVARQAAPSEGLAIPAERRAAIHAKVLARGDEDHMIGPPMFREFSDRQLYEIAIKHMYKIGNSTAVNYLPFARELLQTATLATEQAKPELAEWDTYKTGVKPWSFRIPANSAPELIMTAMQLELNELRTSRAGAPAENPELDRAKRALLRAGFQDLGGQEWKPPIGEPPTFIEVGAADGLTPLDYRAQGREEVLAIILAEDPEDPFAKFIASSPDGDSGEHSNHWLDDDLRKLLHIGDRRHDAYDRAEAAYWDAIGRKSEAEVEMNFIKRAPFYQPLHDFLAKHNAYDLMAILKRPASWDAPAHEQAKPDLAGLAITQRKQLERVLIGLRDGWATRADADAAIAILAAQPAPQADPKSVLTIASKCFSALNAIGEYVRAAKVIEVSMRGINAIEAYAGLSEQPIPQTSAELVAPWPDFAGQRIVHGDRLLHPQDGTEFMAIRLNGHAEECDAWRAVYSDGTISRLCLQIGDKGQAVLEVVNADMSTPPTAAVRDILAERQRQVEQEGWTHAHDDQYTEGQMPRAAACYATINSFPTPLMWPWAPEWWKPRDFRSNYVRAAALLVAEIERIDRAAITTTPSTEGTAP